MISKKNLQQILLLFETHIGNKKSELNYKNPYTFAVAVLLSAQATDKSVNIATKKLFEIIDNPQDMINLGEEKLKEYIKTIGLFNNKAKHIIAMSKTCVEKFDGKLPATRDELMQLAGIGRKSANVILNELYDAATIGVDTHVLRLTKRLDFVDENITSPEKTEEILDKIIPQKYKQFISNYLVLHGRYVCKAVKPQCEKCYLQAYCKYFKNK